LEHRIEKGVFLAPKVYGFKNEKGDTIIKVKGLKQESVETLTIDDLSLLLNKDTSREFIQEKWNKKLFEGEISTEDVIYTLKVNNNKRRGIYINNKLCKTVPYYYYKDDNFLYDYDYNE
jgi:hypothetical protein